MCMWDAGDEEIHAFFSCLELPGPPKPAPPSLSPRIGLVQVQEASDEERVVIGKPLDLRAVGFAKKKKNDKARRRRARREK